MEIYKKIMAFTMAETLITLGIIGIIAAMTLPSLVAKYQSKVLSTQLKKLYSVTYQAMLRAVPDGDFRYLSLIKDGGGTTSAKYFFDNYLKSQFKVQSFCEGKAGCWPQTYTKKKTKYGNLKGIGSGVISFTTIDGYAFTIDTWWFNDADTVAKTFGVDVTNNAAIVVMTVDVNGFKNPNTLGKDVYIYVMTEKGLLPAGNDRSDAEVNEECNETGRYCFSKIMRNNWDIEPNDIR